MQLTCTEKWEDKDPLCSFIKILYEYASSNPRMPSMQFQQEKFFFLADKSLLENRDFNFQCISLHKLYQYAMSALLLN